MSVLLPVFVAVAVAIAACYALLHFIYEPWRNFQYFSKELPGPPALPLIGNAHQLKSDPQKFYQQILKYCREFPKFFRILLGLVPIVVVTNAKDAEVLFSSAKHITKGSVYDFLHPWLGSGLLTSKGSKWFRRRKMLTPTFHFSILSNFLVIFNEKAAILGARLKVRADGRVFDIFPLVTQCSLDIICETAMGKNIRAQEDGQNSYMRAVVKMSELTLDRMKYPWLWPDMLFHILPKGRQHAECLKVLHDTTNQVIQERSRDFDNLLPGGLDDQLVDQPKKRLAFLDLLLRMKQEDPTVTFEDIREEVDTFMFEGHDTTAAGASWCLYILGRHPEIQRRVHDELDEVFSDTREPTTSDQLQRLHYLTRVIKETLRIFPSVPFIARTVEDDCILSSHRIPSGTNVCVLITGLHRDPDVFPNPEEFDPDRFLHHNCLDRHPYAYVPFSAGARNCIGQRFAMMEEKVIVSSVLRRFHIESVQTREEVLPISELILRPSEGIRVKLTLRV